GNYGADQTQSVSKDDTYFNHYDAGYDYYGYEINYLNNYVLSDDKVDNTLLKNLKLLNENPCFSDVEFEYKLTDFTNVYKNFICNDTIDLSNVLDVNYKVFKYNTDDQNLSVILDKEFDMANFLNHKLFKLEVLIKDYKFDFTNPDYENVLVWTYHARRYTIKNLSLYESIRESLSRQNIKDRKLYTFYIDMNNLES
ncbi:MAG: hypothetical protein ABII90_00475, partial [Bacteroidota bacterium]